MTLEMYAIKDELNGFTTPIPFPNEEIARRYFKEQQEHNITIKTTPEDFSIWKMGTFDTESGTYIGEPNGNKLIERGKFNGNKNS